MGSTITTSKPVSLALVSPDIITAIWDHRARWHKNLSSFGTVGQASFSDGTRIESAEESMLSIYLRLAEFSL